MKKRSESIRRTGRRTIQAEIRREKHRTGRTSRGKR